MDFDSFVRDITDNSWNVFGVEVYENNILTHAWGDTEDELHEIYSATKTIESIAVGIAYDRGLIDFDKCILDYLPEEYVSAMSDKARSSYEKITVRRLLTMSVKGFPFRAEGDNWLKFALDIEIPDPEEKPFNYNNIGVYLVGVALEQVLGEDLGGFIEREIFVPMGITRFEYGRSPEGIFYGASKMRLTVHDLSKFGLLLMNGGVYEGRRIVSEEYVKMATSIQQMNREGGYGFYIWKYRSGFSINGKLKQKCYCLPDRGIVVTYLAHIEDDTPDLKVSMERNVLGIEE
jgi:CubicO group peptidase (beta-lactamase class C family)